MKYRPIFCLPLLVAFAPAANAQQVHLPKTMLGTWAPALASCEDKEGETSDSRIAITPRSVEYFASIWSVRSWQRQAEHYRGRAQVAEEGEDKPQPGREPIALRLLADRKLEIRKGNHADIYVKCPRDVPVR